MTSPFRQLQAMVSVTTGTSVGTYAPDGIDGAILDILWPIHNGILRYTGFDVLEPFITYLACFSQRRETNNVVTPIGATECSLCAARPRGSDPSVSAQMGGYLCVQRTPRMPRAR